MKKSNSFSAASPTMGTFTLTATHKKPPLIVEAFYYYKEDDYLIFSKSEALGIISAGFRSLLFFLLYKK